MNSRSIVNSKVPIESSLFGKYLLDNVYTCGIKEVEAQISKLIKGSLPTTVLHKMARQVRREINWSNNPTRARVILLAVNLVYDQNQVFKIQEKLFSVPDSKIYRSMPLKQENSVQDSFQLKNPKYIVINCDGTCDNLNCSGKY